MTSKIRPFYWLPAFLAILACSTFSAISSSEQTSTPEIKFYTEKSTLLPTSNTTPASSATFTPTLSPPIPTPGLVSSSTPAPTLIPLETQLSIFENLWTIVNDTYIYPDFNGLDWNAIHQEYRQKISFGMSNSQFYFAMSALITGLGDDHSFFLNPREVAEKDAEYQGDYNYVGIGVLVSAVPERQRAVILSVFTGSPAEAAGLLPRDSILSVEGNPILDEDGFLRDIVRGPEGTFITLMVQTPGQEPREVRVTRNRITGEVPLIHTIISTPNGKRVGYILLVTFEDSTVGDQVASALYQMTEEAPLDGLILDNRMNGGGSSTILVSMLEYFVSGNLGDFINRNEERPLQVKLNDINNSSQVPLVVLVGSETASFGEIFAGILQDVGRAYLIGKTTQGNVEILWGHDLEDGSKIWLANETFRPVNHPEMNWETLGVIPDLFQPGEFDEFSLENDPVVQAAIGYFMKR
jgi:C-terminal peptidase prc